MATKNNPGVYDCYSSAAGDEPMFILLGRDPMASVLVRLWAMLRCIQGEETAKINEAMECARALENYAKGLGKAPTLLPQCISAIALMLPDSPTEFRVPANSAEGFGDPYANSPPRRQRP